MRLKNNAIEDQNQFSWVIFVLQKAITCCSLNTIEFAQMNEMF
jgi:hypothetical protein